MIVAVTASSSAQRSQALFDGSSNDQIISNNVANQHNRWPTVPRWLQLNIAANIDDQQTLNQHYRQRQQQQQQRRQPHRLSSRTAANQQAMRNNNNNNNSILQKLIGDLQRRDIPAVPSQIKTNEMQRHGNRSSQSKFIRHRHPRRRKLLRNFGQQWEDNRNISMKFEASREPMTMLNQTVAPPQLPPLPPPPPPQFLPPHFLERLPSMLINRTEKPPTEQSIATRPPQPKFVTGRHGSSPGGHINQTDNNRSVNSNNDGTSRRKALEQRQEQSIIPIIGQPHKQRLVLLRKFTDPNDVFLKCCKDKGVDEACESRCNFDLIGRKILTAMFVGSDQCPQSNGRKLLSCAAQDLDHTECCIARGVNTTSAGDKCLGFCQMTPDSAFQIDVSMLPCWAALYDIKQCFKDAIVMNDQNR